MAGSKSSASARSRTRSGGAAGTRVPAKAAAKGAAKGGGSGRAGASPRDPGANGKRQGQQHEATGPAVAAAVTRPAADRAPGPPGWLQWSTFGLAILGLVASAYLTYTHYTQSSLLGCSETSGLVNCAKVTTSAQSMIFGIFPVAVLGLAFYVFMVAIMSPPAWRSGRREVALVRLLSLVVGIGFVLYLVYAELFAIGNICAYCTSVHVITFLLFVLTLLGIAIWGMNPAAPAARPAGISGTPGAFGRPGPAGGSGATPQARKK